MFRGIIPFILALAGFYLISFASINPLFEWQISEVVTDPAALEVSMPSSSWVAWWRDSLRDKSYVFRQIRVWENSESCSTSDLSTIVNRSRKDEWLERLSLTRLLNNENKHWVIEWLLIEICLSVAYGLWFIISNEHRPAFSAIIFVVIVIIGYCFLLTPAVRILAPNIGSYFSGSAHCQGTIFFNAKLLKVYFWVPILYCTGIVAEIAALAMMAYQVARAVGNRGESMSSAVG